MVYFEWRGFTYGSLCSYYYLEPPFVEFKSPGVYGLEDEPT